MSCGEIGAAVERIVRRLLQAGRSLFPSPLWGGGRGGGREVTYSRRRSRLSLPTPHPALPHNGGGTTSLRTDAGATVTDRGIQNVSERRVERRRIRPRRFGAGRLGRVFFRMLRGVAVRAFRHGPNMGRVRWRGKCGRVTRFGYRRVDDLAPFAPRPLWRGSVQVGITAIVSEALTIVPAAGSSGA